ncbi:MAG: purine-cytosine permease family protein [Rubrobacteraceae bacterium]
MTGPEQARSDAAFNDLPVLGRERIWGFWDFASVNVGLAIATWAFLIGGSTALFVGAKTGIAAILIGNVIAVSLMALATCIPSAKYGLEQYTALRSVFGSNGTRLIVLAVVPLLSWGWNAVLAIMFGRAAANVSNAAFATDAGPNGAVVIAFAFAAIAISWFVVVRGPASIEWVNKIVAPGLAIIALVMLVLIFAGSSWSELRAAEPIEPFGDRTLDFMIAIELNLAAGFSWWPLMGNLARLTKSQRAAFWPNMLGLYAAAALASVVGLLAALVLGDSDPTVWMIPLGGVALGALALVFIAFANVTSMVGQTYSSCLALFRLGDTARRLRWATVAGALLLPAAVGVLFPAAVYDNFFKFLAWQSVALASLCGIYFVDFFFLRHRRLDARGLYEPESRSRYAFWAGLNPAALVALAVGSAVYLLLLNPISFEQANLFRFVSASMPAFLAATLTHVLLTKLIIQPLGKGGYTDPVKEGDDEHDRD